MTLSRRRRSVLVALASAVIHAVLLVMLAIGVPELGPDKTPEQPAVQVTLEPPPREPPPAPVKPQKSEPPTSTPRLLAPAPAPLPNLHLAPALPNGPAYQAGEQSNDKGSLERALRASVGCSHADFVGLTEAERDACRRRLRAALPDAGRLSGLTAAKAGRFDRAVRCKEEYEDAPIPQGNSASDGPIKGLGHVPRLRDCPPTAQ